MSFKISSSPLPQSLLAPDRSVGALVRFVGLVRELNENRRVLSLEYEAFDDLALREGDRVLSEAMKAFPIFDAACTHRVGHLALGDEAIVVEVVSAHRKEAFAACSWIVDEIKSRVPIWKKEFYVDGESVWLEPKPEAKP
jgi:molybdopterin synthase catalytic subunit